jgi:hypothetical protein
MKAAETACGEYLVCKRERKAAKLFLITFDCYSYFVYFLHLKLYQVIYDYFSYFSAFYLFPEPALVIIVCIWNPQV